MEDEKFDGGERRKITVIETKLLFLEYFKEVKNEIADECAERIKAAGNGCWASGLFQSKQDVEDFRNMKNTLNNHIVGHKEYNIAKEKRNNRVWWVIGVLVSVFGLAIIKIIIQLSYLSNIQIVSK